MSTEKLDYPSDKPIKIVLTDEHKEQFIQECQKIYDLERNKVTVFCGIDFEFNMNWKLKKRYIAFMQIIFIFDNSKYYDKNFTKPIYIIDPTKLSNHDKQLFIKYILESKVIKILHGSDSLDFPHIFEDILKKDKEVFIKFANSTVDTRFLCEITKRLRSRAGIDAPNQRCSIYNALLDNGAIDKNIFDKLSKIGDKINYNKLWLIESITEQQTMYSAYDVIYLYDLLENISNQIWICTEPDNNETYKPTNLECIDLLSMINRVYRFHMLNRLEILDISSNCNNLFETYRVSKDDLQKLDQQIMETPLTEITFRSGKQKEELIITLEDILMIDVIRKNLLRLLRPYQYIANINANTNKNKYLDDLKKLDNIFNDSKLFKLFKGSNYIIKLIDTIKNKESEKKMNVVCK